MVLREEQRSCCILPVLPALQEKENQSADYKQQTKKPPEAGGFSGICEKLIAWKIACADALCADRLFSAPPRAHRA